MNTILAKPCPFTFTTGPNIGNRCGTLSNGYRCIRHVGQKWPTQSYSCKRVITRGKRKGMPCGKSTKFSDARCSTCRKTKN